MLMLNPPRRVKRGNTKMLRSDEVRAQDGISVRAARLGNNL